MNHLDVAGAIARGLAGEPGWERHLPHHFRHPGAGVHIMVYGQSISVVFGKFSAQRWDKAVVAGTKHTPVTGIESALEVARALVLVRQLAAPASPETPPVTARDILLLIAQRQGGVHFADVDGDPLWGLLGWPRGPLATTVVQAASGLVEAGLATRQGWIVQVTDAGRARAEQLTEQLGLPAPATSG